MRGAAPAMDSDPPTRLSFDVDDLLGVCCRTALRRDHVSCGPAGVGAGMNSIPCRWPIAGTLAKSSGIVRTSRFTSLKNAEECAGTAKMSTRARDGDTP